jgi:hypothetical protein
MKVDLRKVRRIAHAARKWAEEYAEEHGKCSDLMCLCAIASAELHKRLRAAKIPSVIIENKYHCFVLIEDKVVDITATQFKYALGVSEPVFIRKHEDISHHHFYKQTVQHETVDSLREHQKKEGWPRDQIALV